ncbi:hypothetical protein NJB85_04345 [Myroides odoratimimus]|uniref:hypothetical protein n=1 Tax=Myroides odoratimimus TaxID=76832 RepID=UPI002096D035|nr:hypothetical protein [Myroides odoratimimus]MCO7722411.1 hypothetical protein [Myroides odoratimimus]
MTDKSIKIVIGSKSEQPCIYVFDLTENLYEKIQGTRKKLKEIQKIEPDRKFISWKPELFCINPYFLRSNIIRGIEKQERDITGLVSLAIHDKHFTRKVTEEFDTSNKHKCLAFVEQAYITDFLAYFIKDSSIPLKILLFDDFFGFLSLEKPDDIQHISYPISYDDLDDAYNDMLCYYEMLENQEEDEEEDENLWDYY